MKQHTILTFCIFLPIFCYAQASLFENSSIWIHDNLIDFQEASIHKTRSLSKLSTSLINAHPSIEINEHTSAIKIPYNADALARFTFFTVYQPYSVTKEQCIWSVQNGQKDMMLTTHRATGPQEAADYPGGNVSIPVLNTMVQSWGKRADFMAKDQYIDIGNLDETLNDIPAFEGRLAEFIVFNQRLNKLERTQIETALALKYGITLKTDYINSAEEIIWNSNQNEGFNHRIAGIARDDKLNLNQKQASSSVEPHFLTIGAEQISTTNQANPAKIPDTYSMIWADNGAIFSHPTAINSTSKKIVFDRKWLLNVSKQLDEPLHTVVHIDFGSLTIPHGYLPVLWIDRTASNSFTASPYIKPSHISEDAIVSFKNVQWDIDNSGADQFAFGLVKQEQATIFVVAPNPSKEQVNIKVELAQINNINLNIFDVTGKLVRTLAGTGSDNYQFNEQIATPGEYFIELLTPFSTTTQSFIVVE